MSSRIIRIAAMLLGGALLLGGCVRQLDLDPAREGDPISFSAGSTLLRDDATKGAVPTEAGNNVVNFLVFGTKTVSNIQSGVFGGDFVSYENDTWIYSPLRFWDLNASIYEFLAISGPSEVNSYTPPPAESPITATLSYNPTDTQYDLMAACNYRVPNDGAYDTGSVMLAFEHLLSAVSVVVYNDSPQQHVTLLSYGFRNLYIQQNVKVSYHLPSPTTEWLDAGKVKDTSNPLLTWTANGEAGRELNPDTHAPTGTVQDYLNWDMMIPQTLNPVSSAPLLMVKYCLVDYSDDPEPVRTVSNPIETPIRLSSITNSSGNEILEWEAGKKYTYEIHIRYGGGISVTVTTSDWDPVSAGTPGLIIS